MTSLAIVLKGPKPRNGRHVFESFKDANSKNFWNRDLVEATHSLQYMGFLRPGTLFVSGSSSTVQKIKTEYARRVLKPPTGYTIVSLGNMGVIQEVPQLDYVPLGDIVCDAIAQLNSLGHVASMDTIQQYICEHSPSVSSQCRQTMRQTIQSLINTGLVYTIGDHFFVCVPAQSMPNKQTVQCQTGTSIITADEDKKEKKSLIARLFNKKVMVHARTPPLVPPPAAPAAMTSPWKKTNDAMCEDIENRYYAFNDRIYEEEPKKVSSNSQRRRRRRHQRIEHSSSSECLNYGPIDPPECLPDNIQLVVPVSNKRQRDRNGIARTSTPIESDSAYAQSPTDSNEEPWSDHDDQKVDHTYMNLHHDEDSTKFEEISSAHVVPHTRIHISNV